MFWQAVRAALQKLEGGGSVHDAKAFCGTDILFQVMNWKVICFTVLGF